MNKKAIVLGVAVSLFLSGTIAVAQADLRTGVRSMHSGHNSGSDSRNVPGLSAFDGGSYHRGANLFCSQCHTMHASQTHAGLEVEPGAYPREYTPAAKLLKAADPVSLCLMCHDNQMGIPDVVGADVNNLNDRAAGFFGTVDVPNDNGHKIGTGIDAAVLCERCHTEGGFHDGAGFTTASVSCIDCHNPHGNGRSRNLQWASYPGGEYPFCYFIRPGTTGLDKYESANVAYGAPQGTLFNTQGVEVSNMCIDCHHSVFQGTHSGTAFIKHPVYNSEGGQRNTIAQGDATGKTVSSHWIDGTGAGFGETPRVPYVVRGATTFAAAKTVAATNGAFCLSCHKAHGSDEPFGLLFNAQPGGEGCDQCHNKTAL